MKFPRTFRGDYIQGQFLKMEDPNGEIPSRNPGDLEHPVVPFPFSFEHVHEAVTAARRAFPAWKRLPAAERATVLKRYRDQLKERGEEIAKAISFEVGKPLWESRDEVADSCQLIDYYLKAGSQTTVELRANEPNGSGVVRFMPRGVFAVITPAPVPVFATHLQSIPALLSGDTVVLKASKCAPFVGQLLAEVTHDSGLPAGVMNVLQGDAELGRRLVSHQDVDGVLFTGSYEIGAKIKKQLLSDYWKLLVLETGGKNAMAVWHDCNYEQALKDAMVACYLTSGQRSTSTSRILVHGKLFDRFVDDFHKLSKKCTIGFGLNEGKDAAFLGPLVTEQAMENYLRFQGIAVREGAEEIMRGKPLERPKKGYYVAPSIYTIERPDAKSVYQTHEIYGPNVCFYRVEDLEQTAEIINLTRHGLVASLYTGARENYVRLAEEARVGLLHWNRRTTANAYMLPYGGIKQSGNSRPMGSFAGYQCTYPLSSLEAEGAAGADKLPDCFPKVEK